MPLITWDASCSVGHAEIDAQHVALFKILNQFFDALKDGQADEAQQQLLDRFVDHVHAHFETEERELQRVDYHDLVAHRRLHENLIGQIDDFVMHFHTKKQRCPQLIQILAKRFLDHFEEADRAYARYFTRATSRT